MINMKNKIHTIELQIKFFVCCKSFQAFVGYLILKL